MFVSTKVLTLMQCVPAGRSVSAQMKALFEQRERGALTPLPSCFCADQGFDVFG